MPLLDVIPEKDYKKISEAIWQYVFERDNGLCQITGKKGEEVHHILPKSHGGTNKPNNLILLSKEGHKTQHGLYYRQGKMPIQREKLFALVKKNEERLRRRYR